MPITRDDYPITAPPQDDPRLQRLRRDRDRELRRKAAMTGAASRTNTGRVRGCEEDRRRRGELARAQIVAFLAANGHQRVAAIARGTGYHKGSITRWLGDLVAAGQVSRRPTRPRGFTYGPPNHDQECEHA